MAKASFNEPNAVPNIAGWHDVPCYTTVAKRNLGEIMEAEDQMSLQIYLRLRPALKNYETSSEDCFKVIDAETIEVRPPAESATAKSNRAGSHDEARYIFHQIFEQQTSQKVIFNSCVLNPVHNFISGKNTLLFTFGTTNAGKTYTIHGTKHEPGIIPRVLSILFQSIRSKQCDEMSGLLFRPEFGNSVKESLPEEIKEQILLKESILNCPTDASGVDLFQSAATHITDHSFANNSSVPSEFSQMEEFIDDEIISVENEGNVIYSVWVSFLEVYNECIYDLLVPPTAQKRVPLKIAQDKTRNNFVKGLKYVHVTSGIEAYKVLLVGKKNLQVASTNLNRSSSRSHCVFSIKLIKRENVEEPNIAYLSSFSICDLAGAERLEKAGHTGPRMKETQNINTSLHVLGRCFKTMLENQKNPSKPEVVPYRDSKLTQLFHRQLSGKFNEGIIMIVNVNPSVSLFDETLHVLKASAVAKQIIKRPPRFQTNKRQSMFSALVHENKNRETIPWEGMEETVASETSFSLEQLYANFELEKKKIREECEAERLRCVKALDDMIEEMILENREDVKFYRDAQIKERLRREKLFNEVIANLKAEIEALTGEPYGMVWTDWVSENSSSSLNSDARLEEMREENIRLKAKLNALETKEKEPMERIQALEEESLLVPELNDKLNRLMIENNNLSKSNEKLRTLLEEARHDMLQIEGEKSQLQEALTEAEVEIADLKDENNQLKLDVATKAEMIESVENEYAQSSESIKSLETELAKKKERIEVLEVELAKEKERIEVLEVELDQLREESECEFIKQERILSKIELERDDVKKENCRLNEMVEHLTRANEEKDAKQESEKTILKDLLEKQENENKNLKSLLEQQKNESKILKESAEEANKQRTKRNARKQIDFDNAENDLIYEAKSETKRQLRTRRPVKAATHKFFERRSKSFDSRPPLAVQSPNNLTQNRTPSPNIFSVGEKQISKSCKKRLYGAQSFFDDMSEQPIEFNAVVLSSPKSEFKQMKRRLRTQKK